MAFAPGFFGYNFIAWLAVSVLRFATEQLHMLVGWSRYDRAAENTVDHISPHEVAAIMAARNEEKAIGEAIEALLRNMPASNIYIGSDGSTDNTVQVARRYGCNVVDLHPNRGKARVLSYLLRHFHILERFKAVLIMDAEVVVSDTYLAKILPYFDDPQVAAFLSHSTSRWYHHVFPRWSMFYTAYRTRLWIVLYYGLRFGQTWKYTCATPIIPGGSSVYRSSALAHIEIDTPGMIIEDFHMTFQVYHKKLGRIASHPSAYIVDQEPYSMKDYTRQVYRWFLGFWQAVFYHGYWPSFFWYANALFVVEMLLSSIVMLTIPFLVIAIVFTPFQSFTLFHLTLMPFGVNRVPVTIIGLVMGLLVLDYVITIFVAIIQRKPLILVYGLGFFILRYIDTFIFMWTLPLALLLKTETGSWIHPVRK